MQPLCYYIDRTGENSMSKYCRPMGLYVTYLDCMECEDKECITKREEQTNVSMEEQEQTKIVESVPCMENVNSQKGEQKGMKKVYLLVDIGSEIFLVFASKKEGYKDNVVVKCRVAKATVYEKEIIYSCEPIKVVTKAGDKEIKHWVSSFMFKNANIDTGYRNKPNRYPVFTTKEECLQWLKG